MTIHRTFETLDAHVLPICTPDPCPMPSMRRDRSPRSALAMGAGVSIVMLTICPLAFADDPPADQEITQKADSYFARGKILFEEKEYGEAAEAFALAYETAPHSAVLANLALSYDRANKVPQAVEAYRIYLEDPIGSANNAQMAKRLQELETMVADLSIVCQDGPCQVVVDGVDRGPAPVQVVLLEGQHRVEAFEGRNGIYAADFSIGATEARTLVIRRQSEVQGPDSSGYGAEPAEDQSPGADSGLSLRAPFWILSAVAVGAGVVTAVFGAQALEQQRIYKKSKYTDKESKDKGERYKLVTNIMAGVTAVSGCTAFAFAVYDLTRGKKDTNSVVKVTPGPSWGVAVNIQF